jgi:type I restriction enzyme S subunit
MVAKGYKEEKLGDICNFYLGLTYTPKYVDEGVPFLSVKDITKGYLSFEKTKYISYEEFESSTSNAKPKKGDVIFGRVGTLGRPLIVETDIDFCIFVSLGFIRVNDKLHNRYLKQWMSSHYFTKQVDSKVIGSAQKNLNVGWLRNFKIPLPPLQEQEKIADILSTADDKIDAITTQIEKAETLKKGLLQKLLSEGIGHSEFKDSELGKIPESWEVVELPHITDKITSGGTPSRKKAEYFENGTVNWIKTGELRDCYIYNSKEKITEDAVANSSAKVFPIDTLLIAMYGATIGRTAYLKTECSTNQACCAIIFNQSIADPYFYWKYFHFIKDDLISQGRGAGQPNISQSIIKTLLVPLPPLEEQKQIADILSTADEKLEVLRAKKEKYETLKKGLLQKLLSGEVRV